MNNRADIIRCFFDAAPFVSRNLTNCIFRGFPLILAFVFLKSYPHLFKDAATTEIYAMYEGFPALFVGFFFILFFQWWTRYSAGIPARLTGFRMKRLCLEFSMLIILIVLVSTMLPMFTGILEQLQKIQFIAENTAVRSILLLFLLSPLVFILWFFFFPMIALSQPFQWRHLKSSLRGYKSFVGLFVPVAVIFFVISYGVEALQISPASLVLQNMFRLSEITSEGISSAATFLLVFLFIAVLISTTSLFFKRNFDIGSA